MRIVLKDLRNLFDEHQRDGAVDFMYDTRVFYGRLS